MVATDPAIRPPNASMANLEHRQPAPKRTAASALDDGKIIHKPPKVERSRTSGSVRILTACVLSAVAVAWAFSPAFVTWDITRVENLAVGLHAKGLRVSSTLSLNVTVANPNWLPFHVGAFSSHVYYPDGRYLGTGRTEAQTLYYGDNAVHISLKLAPMGLGGLAVLLMKSRHLVWSQGTTSVIGGGLIRVDLDLMCEHHFITGHYSPLEPRRVPTELKGARCTYTFYRALGRALGNYSGSGLSKYLALKHSFGAMPPVISTEAMYSLLEPARSSASPGAATMGDGSALQGRAL